MKLLQMLLLLAGMSTMTACAVKPSSKAANTQSFSVETMKPIIQERGTTWSKAIKTKNITLIKNLYDENAHYLPNDDHALHGNAAISAYWEESFDFLGDLQLNMESLEGTVDLLYETGKVTVQIMDQDGQFFPQNYKYVNVWKKQVDGSYRVVIDTFNNLKNE